MRVEVNTHGHPAIELQMKALLQSSGWSCDFSFKKYPFLLLNRRIKDVGGNYAFKYFQTVEQLDAFTDWQKIVDFITVPQIKVGDHFVEFASTGIKVGCAFVPKETALEIAKRLQEVT
jgi:hypothetical protein